ncbi:histidine kinase [Actinophytocola sp.]|uniref:histidine kinase n=1 Tax=Actinophytocola sp. TaxID=1872138 RepID=UPI002ED3DA0D
MGRYLAAAALLVANVAVFVAGLHGNEGIFVPLVIAAYGLTVWTAYTTGRVLRARADLAVVAGTALVAAGLQIAYNPQVVPTQVSGIVVFLVLPLLVGRYRTQHWLFQRTEQALLAEQEQLRERLRIARDMHDSLGRRLSLVSVQAAALEVSDLPTAQKEAVTTLAGSARDAVAELYQLIGSLRGAADDSPGVEQIPAMVEEFRAVGAAVTVTGSAGDLPPAASRAAYRVIEEGLTNAAKHATGQPVSIQLNRETGTLIITMTNSVVADSAPGGGYGLAGLAERAGAAGGFVDHRVTKTEFRLMAMLPTTSPDLAEPSLTRTRVALIAAATVTLLFILLPATVVVGVGG